LFDRLPEHVGRLGWDGDQVAAWQRSGLRALLAHACERSPFHARRLSGIDPATVQLEDLGRVPVMTKTEMMSNFDEVVTDRRLTRARVEQALAGSSGEPVPIAGAFLALATGGSSGQRGVFVLDAAAWIDWTASLLRPSVARTGGGLPPGFTVVFVAAPAPVHATGLIPLVLAGEDVTAVSAPATLPLPALVDRLERTQPDLLLGYPTVLARLARERASGRLGISPAAVTSTSETLTPALRAAIRSGFGVPVVDSYGSSEGLAGASAPDDTTIVFNSDGCIVELVDEHNHPVPVGTPSAKVLLTNLTNLVQPLIRYEITDRFVAQPGVPGNGHLRARVEGRADDILRYGRVAIHPIVIRSALLTTPAVLDYRVRQTTTGIDLTLLLDADGDSSGEIDLPALADLIAAGLTAAGLREPTVDIHATSTLDRHPETGKLQRVVGLTTHTT
jgi:phenylacetate-coenzyme A ligase PaaK-like adenylate-forming protein